MAQSEVNSDPKYASDEDMFAEMKKLLKALKKTDVKINKLDHEVKLLKMKKKPCLKQTCYLWMKMIF